MRTLVVSNFYPPSFVGGYELGCFDVVEGLKHRGHRVTVLTSDYEAGKVDKNESEVWRTLPLHSNSRVAGAMASCIAFAQMAITFRPDVVYFWNQAGLSFWLAPLARLLRLPCVFFISDTSFIWWRIGAFLRRWVTRDDSAEGEGDPRAKVRDTRRDSILLEGRMITQGQHCQFASEFLRTLAQQAEGGGNSKNSVVILWGIDSHLFTAPKVRRPLRPLRLLFVGQIIPEKGVHTLLEAIVHILAVDSGAVRLTIVGGTSKPAYLEELMEKVRKDKLGAFIEFAGKKERSELVQIYQSHDVLILPSIWDEPFAITPLEAMAAGLAVVATTTGGSAEIFRDGDNCLTFHAGDAEACAAAVLRLQQEPQLYERIRRQGASDVADNFTLAGMIDKIEADLLALTKR